MRSIHADERQGLAAPLATRQPIALEYGALRRRHGNCSCPSLSHYPQVFIMLVSAKQQAMVLPLKHPGEDPTAEAASGLQSAALQALRDNVQAQASQGAAQAQESFTRKATQQVNAATAISDKVDEAFAKTRVQLQTVASPAAEETTTLGGSATAEFKDYMSKTPEERLRDSILEEMGITEEEFEAMPPEKQMAVSQEIAQRMQDKSAIAQVEKAQQSRTDDKASATDMFLASL